MAAAAARPTVEKAARAVVRESAEPGFFRAWPVRRQPGRQGRRGDPVLRRRLLLKYAYDHLDTAALDPPVRRRACLLRSVFRGPAPARSAPALRPDIDGRRLRLFVPRRLLCAQVVSLHRRARRLRPVHAAGGGDGAHRGAHGRAGARGARPVRRLSRPAPGLHRQRQPRAAVLLLRAAQPVHPGGELVQGLAQSQPGRLRLHLPDLRRLGGAQLPAGTVRQRRALPTDIFRHLRRHPGAVRHPPEAGTQGLGGRHPGVRHAAGRRLPAGAAGRGDGRPCAGVVGRRRRRALWRAGRGDAAPRADAAPGRNPYRAGHGVPHHDGVFRPRRLSHLRPVDPGGRGDRLGRIAPATLACARVRPAAASRRGAVFPGSLRPDRARQSAVQRLCVRLRIDRAGRLDHRLAGWTATARC